MKRLLAFAILSMLAIGCSKKEPAQNDANPQEPVAANVETAPTVERTVCNTWPQENCYFDKNASALVLTEATEQIEAALSDPEKARALLDANFDVNARTRYTQQTPLFYAKHAEVTKMLLERGADAKVSSEHGYTPLFFAPNAEALRLLIDAGANVHAVTGSGENALFYAPDAESVKLLANAGLTITDNAFKLSPLCLAKSKEVFDALVQMGADLHPKLESNATLLFMAQTPQVAQAMLDAGIDIQAKTNFGTNAIFSASSLEVAKVLIQNGIDTKLRDENGNNAIAYQVLQTSFGLLDLDASIIQALIDSGVSVNDVNDNGETPIFLRTTDDVLDVLLAAGARLDIQNKSGSTPIDTWVSKNNPLSGVHRMLAKATPEILNLRDNNGETVLFHFQNDDYYEEIIAAGIDIHIKNNNGETAIFKYLDGKNASLKILKRLTRLGADVEIKNKDGKTPLQLATDPQTKEILEKAIELKKLMQ